MHITEGVNILKNLIVGVKYQGNNYLHILVRSKSRNYYDVTCSETMIVEMKDKAEALDMAYKIDKMLGDK